MVRFLTRKFQDFLSFIRFVGVSKKLIAFEYKENPPIGPANLSIKMNRVNNGGPFECSGMAALNKAVAGLVGNEKRIVNIGAGTGMFEQFVPAVEGRQIVSSELDEECVRWCIKNRHREDVKYCSKTIKEILSQEDKFDLAVCIDVIEHIENFSSFLSEFSRLSSRAVITTPNKARDFTALMASPPKYVYHVREWTAGEFYWVLKAHYREVNLYGFSIRSGLRKTNLMSMDNMIVAECLA
jgi:2-polyprenyl-3-methyl-5-hydroxy-6-metoxy-1,4-benzoquinol methylase